MEDALDKLQPDANATFNFGRPLRPHGYQAKTNAQYLRDMYSRVPAALMR
jgi:hypothetical protein